MTLPNTLSALALASLFAAPATAQCAGASCGPERALFSTDPATSIFPATEAPFPRQPMFSLPQFDPNEAAAEHQTSPDAIELVCVQLDLTGDIVPSGTLTNNAGASCTASWSYQVQAAIYANPEISAPGAFFLSSDSGAQLIGGGEDAVLDMDELHDLVGFSESSDFTGWIGAGDLVWEGDGLAFSNVTGCTQITADFSNTVMLSATVIYTYCIPDNPPPTGPGTPYCFGDASGTDCPCANHSMVGAGQGCLNGTGVGAKLTGLGSNSLAMNNLSFSCTGLVPNQPALLFSAELASGGGDGVIFGDGLRCAGQGVIRHGQQTPNGAGTATWPAPLPEIGQFSAGQTRRFQAWYRSPGANSPCGQGFNLSNGYEVVFTP